MLPVYTTPEPLTPSANAALKRGADALAATRNLLGLRTPVRRLHVLLTILELERGTLTEIADRVGAPVNTVWSDLQALGESCATVPLGRNLVLAKCEDPGPRLRYYLTLQGRRIMGEVLEVWSF